MSKTYFEFVLSLSRSIGMMRFPDNIIANHEMVLLAATSGWTQLSSLRVSTTHPSLLPALRSATMGVQRPWSNMTEAGWRNHKHYCTARHTIYNIWTDIDECVRLQCGLYLLTRLNYYGFNFRFLEDVTRRLEHTLHTSNFVQNPFISRWHKNDTYKSRSFSSDNHQKKLYFTLKKKFKYRIWVIEDKNLIKNFSFSLCFLIILLKILLRLRFLSRRIASRKVGLLQGKHYYWR